MIRQLATHEMQIIQNLAHQIWPHTFRDILSEAQIEYMLDWMYNKETLQLQCQSGHEFYVYYQQDQPIGFMGIEKIGEKLKLHKLYVLPHLQGKGIGKAFIEKAIERAKALNCNRLFLNVNRFNTAVKFYEHIGMSITKEENIDIGNGYWMEDYVFELAVQP
jgi:GNAT superfamily N-acetyltransferase